MKSRTTRLLGLTMVLALILAACGGDGSGDATTTAPAAETTEAASDTSRDRGERR